MNIIATLEQVRRELSELRDWYDEEAAKPKHDNNDFYKGYYLGRAGAYDEASRALGEVIAGLKEE